MKFHRTESILFSLLMLLGVASCVYGGPRAEGSFERTLQVTGPVDLDVSTGSGSIRVRSGSASVILIHGVVRARDGSGISAEEKVRYLQANPPVEQSGNRIQVGRIQDRRYGNNVSISYEIEVPAETRAVLGSGSGSISADGLAGPVKADTGSGSIDLNRIGAEVDAQSGSGSIRIESVNGRAEASTGSGSIRAAGVGGPVKASSGSGSIFSEQTAPGDADLETGSGTVEAHGVDGALHIRTSSGSVKASGRAAGNWSIRTSSGSATVRLDGNAAFDLWARTSSGRITVNHPLTVMGTMSRSEIRGKVRGGGSLVEVKTSSGGIVIQ